MKIFTTNFFSKPISFPFLLSVNIIVAFAICIYPFLVSNRYGLNIGVTWAGAFRLMEGQMPYVDFGIPMGVGFFLIPAIFFKLISPQFFTLLIAQLFINVVFLVSIYKLFSTLSVPKVAISLGLLSLSVIYVARNYWPWYNNSVIFYEFISITSLVYGLTFFGSKVKQIIYVVLAGLGVFLTFITKQDAGALTILISFILLLYHGIVYRNFFLLPVFLCVLVGTIAGYFAIFKDYDISYWFNYGQPPHFSRLNLNDLLSDFFIYSQWEKFYLTISLLFFVNLIIKDPKSIISQEYFKRNLFLLLTIGVFVEAMIFQVTSYNPAYSNVFFYGFGVTLLIYIGWHYGVRFTNGKFVILCLGILFVYSTDIWNKVGPRLADIFPELMASPPRAVVSKDNYCAADKTNWVPAEATITHSLKTLEGLKVPVEVVEAIGRMKNLDVIKNNPHAKVLNMSELTFLEYELGVDMLRGSNLPLWYHVGVCMFDREIQYFQKEVDSKNYDLIIFETIPHWKDYYPNAVRDHIIRNYQMIDRFIDIKDWPDVHIEVYIRK